MVAQSLQGRQGAHTRAHDRSLAGMDRWHLRTGRLRRGALQVAEIESMLHLISELDEGESDVYYSRELSILFLKFDNVHIVIQFREGTYICSGPLYRTDRLLAALEYILAAQSRHESAAATAVAAAAAATVPAALPRPR